MNKKIKILHLEDTPSDAELVERELKRSNLKFEKLVVSNQKDYEKALNDFSPDIVLSDHSLPSFDSTGALKILKEKKLQIPFILITATMSEEFAVQVMKDGVADYILKDRLQRLPNAITNALEVIVAENEKREVEERYRLVTENPLLGIAWTTADGKIFHVNDTFCKMIGYESSELSNLHFSVFTHPDDVKTELPLLEKMKSGAIDNFLIEKRYLTRQHEIIWVEINLSCVRNKEGNVRYFIKVVQDITSRKTLEEKLKHNENRFRTLIEKSTDMITLASLEGKIIYASPSITKILGYSVEEFLEKSPGDLVHPEDLTLVMKRREEIMQTPGKSIYNQQRVRHKNGNWIWCESTLTNMLHDPAVNAMIANFRDISEKKLAEEQQQFAGSNLNALINNTPDLMWSVDRDFNLITSNQPFDEMSKLNFGKVIPNGENVLSASYSPEMLKHFKGLYERAFEGESFIETEHFDYPVEMWSEISYYPIFKGKEVIGTACHSRDITERKKTEEKIKQNETRLREAQALANTGNFEIDLVKNEQTWSDELYNILGLKKGEVQPSPEAFLSFMHPDDADFSQKKIQEAFTTSKDSSFNFRFIRKDGASRYGYTEARFEFDRNNKPLRLYGIVQDVTDRKIAAESLERQNRELKKTNSELDRFVYSTSHDLRAPLSSMLGLIELLKEDAEPGNALQEERMEMMKQSVTKLDNFIEDILHYSRNARTEVANDDIVFEDLMIESRLDHKFMEGTSGLNLQVGIKQKGKFISDKRRISIVLNNLVSNAVKYKDKAKEKSTVRVTIESGEQQAIICVQDNGIGIADKDKERIFEMFYRGSKQSSGSGLGLYIVKETLEKLGGTITVDSEKDVGSKFTVIIPNLLSHESKKNPVN